jgi:Tfp pilus assembly protein PilF
MEVDVRSFAANLLLSSCCGLVLAGCSGGLSSPTASNPFAKSDPAAAQPKESWWAKRPSFMKSKAEPPFGSQPDSLPSSISLAGKQTPPGATVYIATAQLHEKSGNYASAAEHYEKALKAEPNNLPSLLGYARLLDRQNKLVEATTLYERAAKAHPQSPAAHNDLALCYARRGMMSQAIDELNLAVKQAPDRALYRNNLATVFVHQNRLDEALLQLKAVHTEPIAYYNLGYLLQQQGQDALAMAQFNRAAQIDPNFYEARDWSQRIASKTPGSAPAPAYAAPAAPTTSPPTQLASLSSEAPRPNLVSNTRAYERAPEPGPPPSYLRSQPASSTPPANSPTVGSRYAGSYEADRTSEAPSARAYDISVPTGPAPAPRTAPSSPPSGEAEYRFLPAVGAR